MTECYSSSPTQTGDHSLYVETARTTHYLDYAMKSRETPESPETTVCLLGSPCTCDNVFSIRQRYRDSPGPKT